MSDLRSPHPRRNESKCRQIPGRELLMKKQGRKAYYMYYMYYIHVYMYATCSPGTRSHALLPPDSQMMMSHFFSDCSIEAFFRCRPKILLKRIKGKNKFCEFGHKYRSERSKLFRLMLELIRQNPNFAYIWVVPECRERFSTMGPGCPEKFQHISTIRASHLCAWLCAGDKPDEKK